MRDIAAGLRGPEPASIPLLGAGLISLIVVRRPLEGMSGGSSKREIKVFSSGLGARDEGNAKKSSRLTNNRRQGRFSMCLIKKAGICCTQTPSERTRPS